MSSEKSPNPIAAIESIRMKAKIAMGYMVAKKELPFGTMGDPQGAGHLKWAAALGDDQAKQGLSDTAMGSIFFQKALTRFEDLPLMPRLAAKGLTGVEAQRDRIRLAMAYAGHSEFGEAQEMLASIEAKRIVFDRGFPKYWSNEQRDNSKAGVECYMDRMLADSLGSNPEKRREMYAQMGSAIGCLGGNCDLLSMFAHDELAREGANPEKIKEIDASQAELLGCAKNMQAMPSLGRSVGNIVLAGIAGVGMAAAAPFVGHALMPYLQELATAAPYFKGMLASASALQFSAGTAVSCAAIAASVGSFMGVGYKNPSRLDALGEAKAINAGLGFSEVLKSSAKAADQRLCQSFANLSQEMLSETQREVFVESLGYCRARLIGGILRNHFSNNFQSMASHARLGHASESELALLGQISEPSIAACFLLDAATRSQRLDLLMLQKRLDYLGASERDLDTRNATLQKASKFLIMDGNAIVMSHRSDEGLKGLLQKRLDQLSPMGMRLAQLCPKGQQAEFLAAIMAKPLNDANPDLDLASRLGETLKVNCARLERKNFFEKHLTAFASKATKALVSDPMRLIRSLSDRLFSKNSDQVLDFKTELRNLAGASGGTPLLGLSDNSGMMLQISKATKRFEKQEGHPSFGSIDIDLSELEAEGSLSRLAEKIRAKATKAQEPARTAGLSM